MLLVGGHGSGSSLKRSKLYDVSAGQWRAFPDMSVARHACSAVCIEWNVYVVGGESDAATRLASMECFDPTANEWRTLPSMSGAR